MRNYSTTDEDLAHASQLTEEDLRAFIFDADNPEASDGCIVEPDGICPHGRPSPLLVLGVI